MGAIADGCAHADFRPICRLYGRRLSSTAESQIRLGRPLGRRQSAGRRLMAARRTHNRNHATTRSTACYISMRRLVVETQFKADQSVLLIVCEFFAVFSLSTSLFCAKKTLLMQYNSLLQC